jgi:5,10-methylene-tetrahydrofolate dehydrogenase/methenyl tetrahydrofolate cyclohydrolase
MDPTACRELSRLAARDAFSDQRAVVIGRSHGLGHVTAMLLGMGGADVTIAYLPWESKCRGGSG